MPNEIELKLRIAADDITRLRRHPALKQHLAGKPHKRRLVSIYYDTPELRLLDAAVSLRVRRMSGNWFQAVKGAGQSVAGLHQRMEWEDIIARGEPDFSKIIDPALTRLFDDDGLRAALKPIFTTDLERTDWQLEYADGSAVEVALDVGELIAGKHREPIMEIELELKHGDARHLFELALALQNDIPLQIENVSKAHRGYACYRPSQPQVHKADKLRIAADTSVSDAFQHIVCACLQQLQGNQDMVFDGNDIEGLHQMHIGLRRLRIALRLFRHESAALDPELAWLAKLLGKTRDWDVLLQETLPAARNTLPAAGYEAVEPALLRRKTRAYRELRAALRSQRYQRLLLQLGAWVQTDISGDHQALRRLAKRRLQQGYEKLRQNVRPSDLSQEQRHRLRIHAKRLRYTAEFFGFACKAHTSHKFLERLVRLLSLLGELNDIAVAAQCLQRIAQRQPQTDTLQAIHQLLAHHDRRAKTLTPELDDAWSALMKIKPDWH